MGSEPNGLFMWLTAQSLNMHLNLIHANGIWSTRCSGVPDLWDPAIVFVIVPAVQSCKDEDMLKTATKTLTTQFTNPTDVLDHFVPRPPTLNRPICSVAEKCEEFGLAVFSEVVPLQDLLADMLQLNHDDYHLVIMHWLKEKAALLPQVHNWLVARSLVLDDYINHMMEIGQCNGLELWLCCVAANININIIQDNHTWSALHSELNFTDPTFTLMDYGYTILCLPEEDETLDVQEPSIDLDPDPWDTQQVQGGRPLGVGASPSTSSSSIGCCTSDTDTDVEELFDAKMSGPVLPRSPGKAKARVCPVCSTELFSGLVLINHMKIAHPNVQLYKCEKCTSNFNNLQALSCHVSVVHSWKKVMCKMCDYKSLMQQHV